MIEAIKNLANAFQQAGYKVEIDWDAEWYCIDCKTHYGIELTLLDEFDCDGDCVSFCFTPNGRRISSCTEAPLKYNKKTIDKRK